MRNLQKYAKALLLEQDGAALLEYGMLVLMVALLCIIAVKAIGSKVANGFNSANSMLP
jgi:Flp pilus assembly pilin Flp